METNVQKDMVGRFEILCIEFLDLSLPLPVKITLLRKMQEMIPYLP